MAERRRVVTVVGARPQFVKVGPLSRAIASRSDVLEEILVHTGQHTDPAMSDAFFRQLDLPEPLHNLGISGGPHGEMTGRMLEAIERVLMDIEPHAVIVYGDTNTTLAGALAAAKLHVPVVHVEAGLRSFDRDMPEEVNRVLVDHLATLLLCPTSTAVANLEAEGVSDGVHHVGDVMYDAFLHARASSGARDTLARHDLVGEPFALATVHRAESTDNPAVLERVIRYLDSLASEQTVLLPVHPRTADALRRHGLDIGRVRTCEPLPYLEVVDLVSAATVIVTDSGGLQKEAYFARTPCVTLRDRTEWVETIECGWNRLWTQPDYLSRREIDEYGDGHASEVMTSHVVALVGAATTR